jgi:DNA polymerase IV
MSLGEDGGRAILHVDMDAFYVGVELRRRPELRGKPVVVGGTGSRGVVAAASYEARRFGVFSAMSSVVARRRCPNAVFLPGDHELYASVSREVHRIFHDVTPLVEPLALDEAFLDVTGSLRLLGTAYDIATHIRRRVADELELACSVGGGTSKFIAKLASKEAKPRVGPDGVRPGAGVLLIEPGAELSFLHPLPVQALWGVGPATFERLTRLGVRTVGDLAALEVGALVASVGKAHGQHLHRLARAIDDRPVEPERAMKSIGHEETFAHDKHTHEELRREAVRLADAVAARLRSQGVGARTVTLKVRFSEFTTVTRSHTVPAPVATAAAILAAVDPLLAAIDAQQGVRLLGISTSNFGEPAEQLSLDALLDDGGAAAQDWVTASETIDAIRERFGAASIGPASTVSTSGLRLVRRGAQQWGPDHDRASEEPADGS